MHNHFLKTLKDIYLFTCTPIPEQDLKQHRTGHHTVNRGRVCSKGEAPDNGHNSVRNMLSSVQVNK
jgi:hypothetical protein